MNIHDGTLSDLLFDEDDEFLNALEEAMEKLWKTGKHFFYEVLNESNN